MYACTDPTSNSSVTNRCQEEVPYGEDEFELDHLSGCRDSCRDGKKINDKKHSRTKKIHFSIVAESNPDLGLWISDPACDFKNHNPDLDPHHLIFVIMQFSNMFYLTAG